MAKTRETRGSTPKDAPNKEKSDETKLEWDLKVFFLHKNLIANEGEELEIVNLRNPGTGLLSKYIVASEKVYELIEFQENFRSFFLGDSVSSNGKIYMTTFVDPVFLVLPYMVRECSSNAIPLDHILVDADAPRLQEVGKLLKDTQLELVCDLKKSGDIRAFKFNEEKTLQWLKRKCEKLSKVVALRKIQCGSSVTSANFVKSEKIENDGNQDDVNRYAFQILSDYITEEMTEKLRLKLGIVIKSALQPAVDSKSKRKSSGMLAGDLVKKVKSEECAFIVEEPPKKSEKTPEHKVTAKSKAMAKAASGTKSISSFFKKA